MRPPTIVAVASCLMIGAAFASGYVTAPTDADPNPIRLEDGVPVGVLDTPSGARAAADNYLASEDNALLSPTAVQRVVDTVWEPRGRAVELAQPFPAAARADKPATFAGLRLTAAVAAQRLESFTPRAARIVVWHEVTIWAPTVSPSQRWSLDTLWLVWQSGRWLVASRSSAPDSQTPVPSWTSGRPQDRTAAAFDTRLAGMSAPYYAGSSL